MDVAMWMRAVRVIPRVDREQWNALDPVARWLIAARSAVLVMTLHSACVAGLLAVRDGRFDAVAWFVLTLGLLLAHATNNLVNDLTDHLKGVDRDNYFRAQYGPQPLEHGLMSKRQMLLYIAATGLAAVACGLLLVAWRGTGVLALMGVGAVFVLFYTWPLKYVGLGEVAVLVVWGPLMVGGGYFVVTGQASAAAVAASLPVALAATTVLFAKHIDKLDADAAKGIRTMPVLLGGRAARAVTVGLVAAEYVVTLALVVWGVLGWPLLVVAGALPWAARAARVLRFSRPAAPPPEYPQGVWPLWYSAFLFQHTRRFGTLYLLGLAADVALHWAS